MADALKTWFKFQLQTPFPIAGLILWSSDIHISACLDSSAVISMAFWAGDQMTFQLFV